MRVIDLTHPIKTGMMAYPGDPEIVVEEALGHNTDYCHVDHLSFGTHTGTHIDAPYHFLPDGKRISDYPVSKFIGYGTVVDLRHKKAGEAITEEDVQPLHGQIKPGDFVVLQTGWYEKFGEEEYLDHPYITAGAADLLVRQGVSIVAVDFMNVDPTLWEKWEAHPALLSNDVLIVENLNNTLELEPGKRYLFDFAPIRLLGSDGGPVRAVAMDRTPIADGAVAPDKEEPDVRA